MKLSIVIPLFNKEATLKIVLNKLAKIVVEGIDKQEIIIVDDCSADHSYQIAQDFINENPTLNCKLFKLNKNQGKGAALREGFKHTSGDVIIIQDADLDYDPQEYPELLKPIINKQADVVYGSRFTSAKARKTISLANYLGSQIVTGFANLVNNTCLTDIETSYKAMTKEVLVQLSLQENRFGFETEITGKISKIKGARIFEVPISYYGCKHGEDKKITWLDRLKTVFYILRYRFFTQPISIKFDPISLLIGLAVIFTVVLLFSVPIDFTSSDIGGHIANGQILMGSLLEKDNKTLNQLLHTNFYSYTQPDYSFINHHWLIGVVYAFLFAFFNNLNVLVIFNIFVFLLAKFFIFKTASKFSNPFIACLITVLMLPLTCFRNEVGPEVVSYFFFALISYWLVRFTKNEIKQLPILSIALIQMLWINTHVFWIFGFLLQSIFALQSVFNKEVKRFSQYLWLIIFSLIASFVNPFSWQAVLKPFNILDYRITTLAGFIMIPLFAATVYQTFPLFAQRKILLRSLSVTTLAFWICCYGFISKSHNFKNLIINNKQFSPANFIVENKIPGPIFNNVDIGSYMIYTLFPKHKVFFDNRSEAYSENFIKNEYEKALGDDNEWQKLDEKYHFNLIFFMRQDNSQFAQPFLIKRLGDNLWQPIFYDDKTLLLIKNNSQNQEIISKYALPKNIFKVVQ